MNKQAQSGTQTSSLGGTAWAFALRWKRWVLPLVSAMSLLYSFSFVVAAAQQASQREMYLRAQREQRESDHDELIFAASLGDVTQVQDIADYDVFSLNQKGFQYNMTPLFAAVRGNRGTVVRFLLRRGANVHYRNLNGETALALARRKGFTEIVKILEVAGAKR